MTTKRHKLSAKERSRIKRGLPAKEPVVREVYYMRGRPSYCDDMGLAAALGLIGLRSLSRGVR